MTLLRLREASAERGQTQKTKPLKAIFNQVVNGMRLTKHTVDEARCSVL
jgi:hypothetical protein